MQLPKVRDLLHRQVIPREVQQCVEQHRSVAVGEHEAVAVGPMRIGGIVPQIVVPQDLGDLRHAHRHAGMAGVRLLHRVHGERTDRVGEFDTGIHPDSFAGRDCKKREL
jgi:hypothetical protein